jgi:hypothetical protein
MATAMMRNNSVELAVAYHKLGHSEGIRQNLGAMERRNDRAATERRSPQEIPFPELAT